MSLNIFFHAKKNKLGWRSLARALSSSWLFLRAYLHLHRFVSATDI